MDKLDHARQYASDIADKAEAMASMIAQRRVGMEKAKARVLASPAKGRLATGWFSAWSRAVGPMVKNMIKLDRLRAKLPAAVARVKHIDARAKVIGAKRERQAAFVASMTVRLDALREVAPAIDARWKVERKAEAKRIKALKLKLRERHAAQDSTSPPPIVAPDDWLKPTVEQPGDLGADETVARPGHEFRSLLDSDPRPTRWDARHVGARLIEAHRVVRMLPENIGPKGFGRAWPAYQNSPDELQEQEAMGSRVRPGAAEIARATEAIGWPIQFLSNRGRYAVALLNYWAAEAEEPDSDNAPDDLLRTIAEALTAAKEPVR
jgi:hypothetical protein